MWPMMPITWHNSVKWAGLIMPPGFQRNCREKRCEHMSLLHAKTSSDDKEVYWRYVGKQDLILQASSFSLWQWHWALERQRYTDLVSVNRISAKTSFQIVGVSAKIWRNCRKFTVLNRKNREKSYVNSKVDFIKLNWNMDICGASVLRIQRRMNKS